MKKSRPRGWRRVLTSAVAVALGVGIWAVPQASADVSEDVTAAAINRCKPQEKWINHLATGGEMRIMFELCVASNGKAKRNAFARHIWWETYSPPGNLFGVFTLVIRLERNDVRKSHSPCVFTWEVNNLSTPDGSVPGTCNAGTITTNLRGGWTADGYLAYRRVGYDSRNQHWQLAGTGSIR
ncbi:hypothetical protein [Actinophytocola sp.]|uniref:hypothetical protein n=1 Tax=Actinophytocola sp. TaxID=1872138 RepID=UPI003D6ACCFF